MSSKDGVTKLFNDFKATYIDQYPTEILVFSAFAVGGVTTFGGRRVYTRYFRRIQNGDWVTPDMIARKRWVKGVVTSVGDSDNFRLYHTPAFGWRWPIKFRRVPTTAKDLKDKTLHIRIGGVDAPEAAHFGRPAQPYSEESLVYLKDKIFGKTLYCQLLRRDQYARIVSTVLLPPRILPGSLFHGKSLSLEMLKDGWVTTYLQSGAEYGKWGKDEFMRVEAEAKAARRGMWEKGTTGESPAEYKRRYADLEAAGASKASTSSPSPKKPRRVKSWLNRLLSR
ncbi:nuclease [Armillaria gallica]|uniref:Nuclease n=1 Tax=Armillaria gallica TaxID=47427 RepID=A0A2H3EBB2_ARMGA|nr:nuclease [Armillaria gallica]